MQLFLGGAITTANILDGIGAAHRGAGKDFDLVLKQTARQGCRKSDSDDGLEVHDSEDRPQ
ncbi:hypothetical protein PsSCT_38910 [Pseudomonas sp. SCT]